MDPLTILTILLKTVPSAVEAYQRIRATLSESDLAALDAQLEAADVQVTADHDALAAAIAAAKAV